MLSRVVIAIVRPVTRHILAMTMPAAAAAPATPMAPTAGAAIAATLAAVVTAIVVGMAGAVATATTVSMAGPAAEPPWFFATVVGPDA